MAELNYTKGNWEARKLLPDKHGIITKEAWEISTPEYDVVAQIIGSAPIRKEADAHLIAASPRMYNACLSALGVMATLDQNKGWVKEISGVIQKALAKAEGKA